MNGLPVEIIEDIFKHMSSLEDITNCFNTCVQWRQIIERLFRENAKVMIATNESREDGGRYVEVIDLINPELVRKFIDTRVALIDLIGGGGLLGDQPVICGGNNDRTRRDCLVIGNADIILDQMLESRYGSASLVLDKSTLWVTGGYNRKSTEFIRVHETPTEGPDFPFSIHFHCLVQVDPRRIYLIGGSREGRSYSHEYSKHTWIIDPKDNFKMKPGPNMLVERAEHACGTMKINGKTFIVAVGGKDKKSVELLDTTLPNNNASWRLGPDLPYKIHCSKLVTSPTGKGVVLIGGFHITEDEKWRRSHSLWELSGDSIENLQWKEMCQQLKFSRASHIAFIIPDQVYNNIYNRERQKIQKAKEEIAENVRKKTKLDEEIQKELA